MSATYFDEFKDALATTQQLSAIRYAAALERLCKPHEYSLAAALPIDAETLLPPFICKRSGK